MGNSWEIHREQIRNNKTREVELNTKHLRQETVTIKQEITLRGRREDLTQVTNTET